jgi:hypothetical protein
VTDDLTQVAQELSLEVVEAQMLQSVLREWPLLGEWLLRELRRVEREAIEALIKNEDTSCRGAIVASRRLRDRVMAIRRGLLGEDMGE